MIIPLHNQGPARAVLDSLKHFCKSDPTKEAYGSRPGAHGAVGTALAAPTFGPKMGVSNYCTNVR